MTSLFPLLALLTGSAAVTAATVPPPQLALPERRTPTFDLALPLDETFPAPHPVVVVIHGGGWAQGDKTDRRETLTMDALVARGYAALSVNYALFTFRDGLWKGPLTSDAWPGNVQDIVSVLSWIKHNGPNHRLDPGRVALLGYSAGGHLALLAAYGHDQDLIRGSVPAEHVSAVRAVISVYGIHDLKLFGASVFQAGARPGEDRISLASPINYLRPDSPPTLVIHGEADSTIPYSAAEDFAAELARRGHPHVFVAVPHGRHGFALSTPEAGPANDALWAFLSELLRPPAS